MAKSQFDAQADGVGAPRAEVSRDNRKITVGGPLEIAAPEDYEHPIVVQFQVVQVPQGRAQRRRT